MFATVAFLVCFIATHDSTAAFLAPYITLGMHLLSNQVSYVAAIGFLGRIWRPESTRLSMSR
jgi:hypothetical protein